MCLGFSEESWFGFGFPIPTDFRSISVLTIPEFFASIPLPFVMMTVLFVPIVPNVKSAIPDHTMFDETGQCP